MPFIDMGDGNWAHINVGRKPRQRCHFCPRWSTKLCDFPVGKGKTCDARICDAHATSVGEDRDYCPRHKNQPAQGELALEGPNA